MKIVGFLFVCLLEGKESIAQATVLQTNLQCASWQKQDPFFSFKFPVGNGQKRVIADAKY